MSQHEEADRPMPVNRQGNLPIIWWALIGAWLALLALERAFTDASSGQSENWMQLSTALILAGLCLPPLFFDDYGEEYSAKALWTAAQRHWSGVAGILLMFSGVALLVANIAFASETIRPSDWSSAIPFLFLPLLLIPIFSRPRVGVRVGALVTVGSVAGVLTGARLLYGVRLQWADVQSDLVMLASIAAFALLAFGVLRLMDWMIKRSERRAN